MSLILPYTARKDPAMARPRTGQTKVLGIRLTQEEMDRYETIAGGKLTDWARKQLEQGAIQALEESAGPIENPSPRELAFRLSQRFEDGLSVGRSIERLWLVFEQGRETALNPETMWAWSLKPENAVEWEAIRRVFMDSPFRERFIRWWAGPVGPSAAEVPDSVVAPR